MFKSKQDFKKEYSSRLVSTYGTTVDKTHRIEKYLVLGEMVRDYASVNWKDTKRQTNKQDAKQVYYFSMEFLLGKNLNNNLHKLGIYDIVKNGLKDLGISLEELENIERDAALGNGGLGRLAACFMDSAATLDYPVQGNCIRYQYGLFRQMINEQGEQVEVPDMWLRYGNPWEIRKAKHAVDIKFYGRLEMDMDDQGNLRFRHVDAQHIFAVPYDMPMIGCNTKTTNTLRLWSAEPADVSPENMDYRKYLSEVSEICMNVYPDDSTEEGKLLRLKQQYFFVAAGINGIIRYHLCNNPSLDNLPEKIAIQLNDTHPVLAIPELMRVLMDDYNYTWDKAQRITVNVMSYTNHTVMREALETWPMDYIRKLLPRIAMIIEEIDARFCSYVAARYPDNQDMARQVRVISNGMVQMARLAIVGSHSVNGVAQIHTEILKSDVFRDFYKLWPNRFSNKTNGVTPRRFLLYNNPELKQLIEKTIGKDLEKNFNHISKLSKYVDDKKVQKEFLKVKHKRKEILVDYIKEATGALVSPDSIFDVQAKRLHAYKRQLLNVLHIIYLYQKIKADPTFKMTPRTFIFAAKAASSYAFAKKVIKLINCVSKVVNNDPDMKGMLKVVFLPNYRVSLSEILMPASDVSEQISTAGKEASGTGNMKFMMNGAITLGTMDGANVEIDELVGRENDVIFGLTVEEIPAFKETYRAWDYYMNDSRLHKALDSLIDGTWNGNADDFRLIYDELLSKNDEYLVLADFDAYVKAQEEIERRYNNTNEWAKSCLINIAKSAYFSSDRTIEDYANEIWDIKPLKI